MNEGIAFVLFVVAIVALSKLLSCVGRLRTKISQYKVQRLAERLAGEAIPLVGLPWKHAGGPLWTAVSEPKHGFRVELKLLARENFVSVRADANFNLEHEFVSRQLLFFLLMMNCKFTVGSFGLSPNEHDGYEIVHGHQCCVIGTSPQAIAAIGRNLVGQMEDTIDWLHANNLT